MLYGDKRQDTREVFYTAWRKYRQHQALEGVETIIVDVASRHPEYHPVLEHPDRFLDKDYSPDLGETNPFLHMGMHVAIEEQLSIDQPQGIRAHYARLCARLGDAHDAQHVMMDCLGEMLWQAQREGTPPDPSVYLDCLSQH